MVRKLIVLAILIGCSFVSFETASAAGQPIPKVTVKEYIVKHSVEMGIPPELALSIAKQESGYCHEMKSAHGAVGVFQLLPSTARKMGYNPYYLSENIKGGLKYYQMMYKQFGSVELALAAYNAGPGNVSRYKGMPPFKETKKFVNGIMTEYKNQKANPDPVLAKYRENLKAKKNILKPQPVAEVQKPHVEQKVEQAAPVEQSNMIEEQPVILQDLLSMS